MFLITLIVISVSSFYSPVILFQNNHNIFPETSNLPHNSNKKKHGDKLQRDERSDADLGLRLDIVDLFSGVWNAHGGGVAHCKLVQVKE
jgi:hypothetical protein